MAEGLLWVMSGSRIASHPLPLFPQQRTSRDAAVTSALCQKRPLGAGVSGGPSIRISLMSTGPWQAIAPYTKKLKR